MQAPFQQPAGAGWSAAFSASAESAIFHSWRHVYSQTVLQVVHRVAGRLVLHEIAACPSVIQALPGPGLHAGYAWTGMAGGGTELS